MVGINIGRKISSSLGLIQLKNLTIRGCIGSPGVWPAAIRFLERTGINLSPIQTHRFGLEDAVKAFELGQDPKACIKITLSAQAFN
jgi:L-iditol 2-dehydrogenase